MDATHCRSCGTAITFASTANSKVLGPFEVDPDGDWVLENGIAQHVEARDDMVLAELETTRAIVSAAEALVDYEGLSDDVEALLVNQLHKSVDAYRNRARSGRDVP